MNNFRKHFFIQIEFSTLESLTKKTTYMESKIPPPILHLANSLIPYGISTGEVKKDQEIDGFYIPNAPHSPHLFQMIYNLDPDWGPIGFQIFSENGEDDIYFGENAVVALNEIVKYLGAKKITF